MRNAIAYIDGFNLFHGLEAAGFRRFYWLDLHKLAQKIAAEHDLDVKLVRYFTSRVPDSHASHAEQQLWLRAVEEQPAVSAEFGDFRRRNCNLCPAGIEYFTEKGTDVSIAVWMLYDYMKREYSGLINEVAILITGDSDLAPAIKRLRDVDSGYPVVVGFPPMRTSGELSRFAGNANCTEITESILEGCCLPNELGPTLRKPAHWV